MRSFHAPHVSFLLLFCPIDLNFVSKIPHEIMSFDIGGYKINISKFYCLEGLTLVHKLYYEKSNLDFLIRYKSQCLTPVYSD